MTPGACIHEGDQALKDALVYSQPPTEEEMRQHGDNLGAELFNAVCASSALATAWYARATALRS